MAVYENLTTIADAFLTEYNPGSLILLGLLHDVCKIGMYQKAIRSKKDGFLPNGKIKWIDVEGYEISDPLPFGHGEKSLYILMNWGLSLSEKEAAAIRWHMGGFDDLANSYGGRKTLTNAMQRYPLITALHMADLAASYFDGK